jgi:hypothetical protein
MGPTNAKGINILTNKTTNNQDVEKARYDHRHRYSKFNSFSEEAPYMTMLQNTPVHTNHNANLDLNTITTKKQTIMQLDPQKEGRIILQQTLRLPFSFLETLKTQNPKSLNPKVTHCLALQYWCGHNGCAC